MITRFASPTVAAGGTAQIQLFLAEPHAFATGSVIVDFDATIFGVILAADVFSATGDQFGTANIKGSHVDVEFQSTTGEIGRLPNVPVVTIVVQVLADAVNLTVGTVSVTAGKTPWMDAGGSTYSITAQPGSLSVGGSLSVQEVRQGGGMLPAGTVVLIAGTGFTADTTVQIDGVSFGSVQVAGPQRINLTLTAPADLTGKHVVVRNPDGTQVDYVSALRGFIVEKPANNTIQPIFPQQTYTAAHLFAGQYWGLTSVIAIENQSLDPVSVTFESSAPTRFTTTLPSGSIYMTNVPRESLPNSNHRGTIVFDSYIYSSAPIRVAELLGDYAVYASLTTPAAPRVLKTSLRLVGSPNVFTPPLLSWDWQIGSAAPVSKSLEVLMFGAPTPFAASTTTSSGGDWLSVSPTQGMTCETVECPSSSIITVTVDPASLAPGIYTGTITVNPMGPNAVLVPTTVSVTFHASAEPVISVDQPQLDFFASSPGTTPDSSSLHVTSSGDPVPISITTSTVSGVNWLSVSASQALAPATLTVSANLAALKAEDSGTVTIAGPANTLTVAAHTSTYFLPPPNITASPSSLLFSVKVGSAVTLRPGCESAYEHDISVSPYNVRPYVTSLSTNSGGNWLLAGGSQSSICVIVDPAGLAVGIYEGKITIWTTQVPVKLIVWDAVPAVTVTPSTLLLSAPSGGSATPQTLRFATGDLPVPWAVSVATVDGGYWLSLRPNQGVTTASSGFVTPATLDVIAGATSLTPGTYHGTVTINAPPGSDNLVAVPVTLTVTAALPALPQPGPPFATFLVNGASAIAGPIAPGEIITILGQNIGPPDPAASATDPIGEAPTNLGGGRVLFDGIPAPLLYASATQVNAIVPYEVATTGSTMVEVEYNGARVPAGGFVLAPTAPAIFTVDSTGQGQAKARNADNSVNSPQNPAARGSVIQVYGTGEGVTSPRGVTGDASAGRKPVLPVTIKTGGADATVQDAVSAPGMMPGVLQVSALVPQNIVPGASVPIFLTIGDAHSQDGVTIAVK